MPASKKLEDVGRGLTNLMLLSADEINSRMGFDFMTTRTGFGMYRNNDIPQQATATDPRVFAQTFLRNIGRNTPNLDNLNWRHRASKGTRQPAGSRAVSRCGRHVKDQHSAD